MFGNLTLSAFQHAGAIETFAQLSVTGGVLAAVALVTYLKKWKYLWREWFTSLDHKKIGIMYIVVAVVMLCRGFVDAAMMRSQQAIAAGNPGYLSPDHFQQIFTAHGVIMIFFVAMPLMFGLLNLAVPLQIGSRDVAFPFLNSLSFWLFFAGAALVNLSLVIGQFAETGWLAYPQLSELAYSPGVGVDYYIWALQIAGLGSLFSGINFFTTIIKMRAPGMTMMRMPIFSWTALATTVLIIAAFPVLTATLGMLFLDRFAGMHFFTGTGGGNLMMYVNLIWTWGHPEVYILILPAFGIFSEVVATFARKRLFGYTSMVVATVAIMVLSFMVWLHHFFTMGAGADVNAVFGIATMIIAIPTGVKLFNWLFTIYRGRVRFSQSIHWFFGFVITFTLGGMTGVLMAVPGVDFQVHNSLFLIAHFHTMIIGGVVFGYFAGLIYWFPKIFGFKLNEVLGKRAFWCWIIGFWVAFGPLYLLGLMGATRRLNTYAIATGWQPLFIVAAIGAGILAIGGLTQVWQVYVSIRDRKKNLDTTGDPWDGRTLEWSIPSPAPFYNFAHIPRVYSRDAWWHMKYADTPKPEHSHYEDIELPKNSGMGFYIALACFFLGFALVWHIIWMVIVSLLAVIALIIARSFDWSTEEIIPAHIVAETEKRLRVHHA